MLTVLFIIFQLILALSILIVVHELGHFLFAKLFGIRVEKFYLFFDLNGKSLWKWKPSKGDTEYGIGIIPLGGYCKISGMIDESFDRPEAGKEPQKWEFRAHPAWQRFFVMFGGVLFNFILAFVIYTVLTIGWGSSYIDASQTDLYTSSLSYDMGFRNGDRILSIDGETLEDFSMLQVQIARSQAEKVEVLRDGKRVNVYIDHAYLPDLLSTAGIFSPAIPFVVDTVVNAENAAVLQRGDRIVSICGEDTPYLQDAHKILPEYAGGKVTAEILRDGLLSSVELHIGADGKIGVQTSYPDIICSREYTFFEAIPVGLKKMFSTTGGYVQDLKLVATPSSGAYKSVGSFITIGSIFPTTWDSFVFLSILAMLSVMLGVVNLLPIPLLDGGHILFLLIEGITGRSVSEKTQIIAQYIGLILLMALMLLAFGNDFRMLFKMF